MKLISLPDHDDFHKSRTALLTVSVILFILSRLNLITDSINILELQIEISQIDLIFYWRLIVVYFLYIFLIRVSVQWTENRLKTNFSFLKDRAKAFGIESDDFKDFLEDSVNPENAEAEFKMILESSLRRRNFSERLSETLIDYSPPLLIAAASLYFSFTSL